MCDLETCAIQQSAACEKWRMEIFSKFLNRYQKFPCSSIPIVIPLVGRSEIALTMSGKFDTYAVLD